MPEKHTIKFKKNKSQRSDNILNMFMNLCWGLSQLSSATCGLLGSAHHLFIGTAMSASHIPEHCPNVTSVAGSMGHTVIQSGTTAQGGSQALTSASLTQEASLGHILAPSNTWKPEELAPFRLQANNPRSTDFSKLKSPQKQSTTVCQQGKKNTSQPGPVTQMWQGREPDSLP